MARNLAPSIIPITHQTAPGLAWVSPTPQVNYTEAPRERGSKRRRNDRDQKAEVPPPLPCAVQEAMDIYWTLVRDGIYKPRENFNRPTQAEQEDPKFCQIHKSVGHATKECFTLRRLLHNQIKRGKLELEAQRGNVNNQPFPDHNDQRPHARVISAASSEVLNITEEEFEPGEHFADQTVEKLSANPKFRNFFDQLGFSLKARIEATRAIMEVASRNLEKVDVNPNPYHKLVRNASSVITFSEQDKAVQHFHNRPLYVTTVIHGIEFPRTLLDGGASVNIMPLKTFREG